VISTAADEKGELLIMKSCGSTEFPDMCTSALESDPRSSTADIKGLSRIALELSATKAKEAAGVANKLMQNSSDYADRSKRTTCFDGYNSTADRIKGEGLKYFEEGKYETAYQIVNLLTEDINIALALVYHSWLKPAQCFPRLLVL
jgi:pectinesterase inhibitor-like protein